MPISLHYSPITVSDPEAALAFYRDALGLPVAQDVSSGGHRWITLGEPGGAQIVLSDPLPAARPRTARRSRSSSRRARSGPLVFSTDDLEALFEQGGRERRRGRAEPADQPWGPRDAAFRDPSGNLVRVQQG